MIDSPNVSPKNFLEETRNNIIQNVIDVVPTPIYFKKSNRQCVFCNSEFQKLIGLPREKIIGFDIDSILFADSLDSMDLLDEVLMTLTSKQNFEANIRNAQGVSLVASVFRTYFNDVNNNMTGIVTALVDVTHRQNTERSVSKALAILNGVLESSNDGFLAVQRVDNENIIVASNKKLYRLFNLNEPINESFAGVEVLAQKVLFPADYWQRFNERCNDQVSIYDEFIELKNGQFLEEYSLPLYYLDEVVGRIWSYRDITEKRLAEQRLKESNERNQALWYQSSDGIFVFDPNSFAIQEANIKFCRMIGYTNDELFSIPVTNIIDADIVNIARDITSGSRYFGALNFRGRKGALVNIEMAATEITYRNKKVIMVNARDITDRVRLEDQILSDVYLAAKVQQQFLPPDFKNDQLSVTGIYAPFYQISGDIYSFTWDSQRLVISGFLLDVSGHGVATSLLTSVLLPLAKEAMSINSPLNDRVEWLNKQSLNWFNNGSYAAGIFFEIDLARLEMNYVPAGIGYIGVVNEGFSGLVKAPGFLLGLLEKAKYESKTLAIKNGDSIFFMSDGITDLLNDVKKGAPFPDGHKSCIEYFRELVSSKERKDDATAVCIHIGESL